MKYILICLLIISQNAFAVELARIHTDPTASSRIKYIITDKEITLKKESNLFDQKADLTLGTFELKNTQKIPLTRLNVIEDEIQRTDALLKKKGSSFNELSASKDPHKPFITVGDYKINEGSNYYAELDKLIKDLSSLPKEHISGISLSNDFKTLTHISNKTKAKKTPFDLRFSCQKEALPTTCFIKGEGFLILKK